jgi:aspartokinase-like uncharacterized kinase
MSEQFAILNVLKVGGSLNRRQALQALGQEIGRLATQHSLLVVPGGGEFSDTVRDYYRRYHLAETTAHRMAVLAMDQFGCLLGDFVPNSALVTDLLMARRVSASNQTPILLPSSLVIQADPIPHTWRVTSDSIAAWVAGLVHARRLILLKDIDGLFSSDPTQSDSARLLSLMSVEEITTHRGGVDEYLATILASIDLETWIINGQHPQRLAELMAAGQTMGTHIIRQ